MQNKKFLVYLSQLCIHKACFIHRKVKKNIVISLKIHYDERSYKKLKN